MDQPRDVDEDPRDNRDEDVNEEPLIPEEEIDEDEDMVVGEDGAMAQAPPDLRLAGSTFRNIGVRAIFNSFQLDGQHPYGAVIILYLLYPDLRRDIVRGLRVWIVLPGCSPGKIVDMFSYLGRFNVAEVEREHSEELLEFVDILGPLMVEARRESLERSSTSFSFERMQFPLHVPLGAVVVAKLLQYAQSVESVRDLTLLGEQPFRAFHPDEMENLVSSILNLKQLERLEIRRDMTGTLLVALCARLKDLQSLSYLDITTGNAIAPVELPNESQLIRNIQQIPSLETLRLSYALLGETTVNLFSPSEAAYTKLNLYRCHYLIGDDDRDPRMLPLAVALASNTRLEELDLHSVQASGGFWRSMEHGLLWNRALQTLNVSHLHGPSQQMIAEPAYIGLMQSIRLNPSLRRLVLDMGDWTGAVADAVCRFVRGNSSLRSIMFFRGRHVEENSYTVDPEWIGAVLQALQVNRTLVDVDILVGSALGDQNWNRLAELLNVNDSIESFDLDAGNDSIPERVIEVLQRVKSNTTLKRLGAHHASFDEKHTSALAEVLAHHFSLVSLVYNDFYPDDEGLRDDRPPVYCSDGEAASLLTGILDLNYYGRKYMVPSLIQSSMECHFFHMYHPTLTPFTFTFARIPDCVTDESGSRRTCHQRFDFETRQWY